MALYRSHLSRIQLYYRKLAIQLDHLAGGGSCLCGDSGSLPACEIKIIKNDAIYFSEPVFYRSKMWYTQKNSKAGRSSER